MARGSLQVASHIRLFRAQLKTSGDVPVELRAYPML